METKNPILGDDTGNYRQKEREREGKSRRLKELRNRLSQRWEIKSNERKGEGKVSEENGTFSVINMRERELINLNMTDLIRNDYESRKMVQKERKEILDKNNSEQIKGTRWKTK